MSAQNKKPKEITCKAEGCNKTFPEWSSLQTACSPKCALKIVDQNKKKKYKAQTKVMKRDFRATDKTYQLRKAQLAFNAFIRQRDKDQPCISCAAEAYKITAGHYKSVGAHPELRFDEDNAHGQCWWNCNRNKSGNIIQYRINLIERIGLERVEELEKEHPLPNYTLEQIIEIKNKFKQKLKALKNEL